MRKILFILGSAFVLFATSCKKEDKTPDVTVQNLAGTYKISKIAVQSGASGETDVTDYSLEDCQKDDLFILKTDLTYSSVDAGVSCGWGNDSGNWSLKNPTTIIIDSEEGTIRKFDGTNLEITTSDTFNGISATFITYFVKQ